jgi:hypothetical protein
VAMVLGTAAAVFSDSAGFGVVTGAVWTPVLYGLGLACVAGSAAAVVWFGPGGPFRGGAGRHAQRVHDAVLSPPSAEPRTSGASPVLPKRIDVIVPPPPP